MEPLHNNPRDDKHDDEEYVAFPGGIPKLWLAPAMTLLCGIAAVYVPWAVWQTIRVGMAASTPAVHIAKDVFHHLVLFAAAVSFLIVVGAKILERVMMYYLQAKRDYLQAKKRVEEAEQRAEEAEQRAQETEQRAEQRAQEAELHAEQRAEQRAWEAVQRAEQRAREAEQRAEKAEQRAREAENGKNPTEK